MIGEQLKESQTLIWIDNVEDDCEGLHWTVENLFLRVVILVIELVTLKILVKLFYQKI